VPVLQPVPRQQPVLRDLALVVGEGVKHDALMAMLRADPSGLIRAATLFDVYKPQAPGRASHRANAASPCVWNCSTSTAR
jgi:phenylalanyl-tRNA synthetase beta chain